MAQEMKPADCNGVVRYWKGLDITFNERWLDLIIRSETGETDYRNVLGFLV